MPIQSQKIKRGGAGECTDYKAKEDCEKIIAFEVKLVDVVKNAILKIKRIALVLKIKDPLRLLLWGFTFSSKKKQNQKSSYHT
jgi:hypothetical protein